MSIVIALCPSVTTHPPITGTLAKASTIAKAMVAMRVSSPKCLALKTTTGLS